MGAISLFGIATGPGLARRFALLELFEPRLSRQPEKSMPLWAGRRALHDCFEAQGSKMEA
jgi:hypothetical protein